MADDKIDYITKRLDGVADKVGNMSEVLSAHVAKFDAHVDQVAQQREDIKRNSDTLHINTMSLQDHIKRTELLEDFVKKLDGRFTPVELEAIRKKAVTEWWKGKVFFMAKLGGALTAVATVAALVKLAITLLLK